ncbi:MAG: PD-(D/E)XK nuclease family protein [Clostridia bacterium]|nr:PD-(D/E)XK nuclease family protein [Clostridia bacterium]
MLKLICGVSGSGKTARLIENIRTDVENGIRCFLLVPEQQAYISERDLPAMLPKNAGLYFEVVNFSSLADDVFREYGGVTAESASGSVRALLMWNTLRTLSPMLHQYGKNAGSDTTLTALMLQTVAEMRSNGIDAEALEAASLQVEASSPLQKKLADVAMIDAVYHAKLEECFGNDPSDKLMRMAQKLYHHHYFENCNVYIDSFTSFTVPEYAVLTEICKQASCVTISLCADGFHSELQHFESVTETAKHLTKLAATADIAVEREVLPVAEKKSVTLSFLEKNIWNFSASPIPTPTDVGAVRLSIAANVYEEAEIAALQICELVQGGMHYGDIAVVMRDAESYRGILDAALDRYGIPYFFSERTDLSSKPIFRMILSALRAVSHNYRKTDVLTLLKTGLCGIDLRDAAMFEEYCETWHIGGTRFTDPLWSMNPDGLTTERSQRGDAILEAANRVREQLISPLRELSAALRSSRRLEDRCHALYDYLSGMQVSAVLSAQAREEISMGQRREAGESIRLYRTIIETLTTLCKLLPNEEISVDEFITALSLVFSNTDLGSVPNAHDCVMIGSADTLRVENVRATLLLGLCEGEFPRAVTDDGVFTESDKESLEACGVILHSRQRSRASEELLYVYRAMTKPTEHLSLLTHQRQPDGSARTPSLAFNRVAFLLNQKAETPDLSTIDQLQGNENGKEASVPLCAAASNTPTTLRLSQSKIQAFVLCPYRYYSTYRLQLREKKDSAPNYADDGTFLHYVFEHFLTSALQKDGTLTLPTEEETETLADAIIADYVGQICPFSADLMDMRLMHLFARLRKLALTMLAEILAEIRTSLFVPSHFEQVIGGAPGSENALPAVKLTLTDGSTVLLNGKIDRVDLYQSEDKLYFRVVDYKSGKHTFSLDEIRSGMDIQLILYLFAVRGALPDASAAGAQYLFASTEKGVTEIKRSGFYLSQEEIVRATDGSLPQSYTKKLTAQSAEEIQALHEEMQKAVCEVAERILAGEAKKTPSEEACTFCPVRADCNRAYHR